MATILNHSKNLVLPLESSQKYLNNIYLKNLTFPLLTSEVVKNVYNNQSENSCKSVISRVVKHDSDSAGQ